MQEAGADVIEVDNVADVEKTAKKIEKIDILIIDSESLQENILKAETELIKISQIKKIITMFGAAELKEKIEESKKVGITDYIIKPVIKSKLIKKIIEIVSIKQNINYEEIYKKEENSTVLLDILIAEDNKINRETIKAMCEKLNQTQIRTVENGKICIEEVILKKPDLILMDIQMPETNGIEATEIIRKMDCGENIPIIGVTAYAFESDIQNFIEKGMNEVITKPVKISELRRIFEKYSPKGQ